LFNLYFQAYAIVNRKELTRRRASSKRHAVIEIASRETVRSPGHVRLTIVKGFS